MLGHDPGPVKNLTCPMLKNKQCSVYPVRPMICRIWGLVRKLRCPHGCEPDRWLTDEEARQFINQSLFLGGE